MKQLIYSFSLCIVLWVSAFTAIAAESVPVKSGRITAQLVTSHDRAMPGTDIHIALSLRMEEHWHTYWRNAGGPGEPAELIWDLPDTLTVGEITWSLPKRVFTGPLTNYAFEDRLLLPMTLHISEDAEIGSLIPIRAEANYLVCYKICLPESASLTLPLLIGEPIKDGRWSANINRTLKNAPKESDDFEAAARVENGKLFVDIKSEQLTSGQYKNPYFYPYVQDLIEASDPQIIQQATDGIRISMTKGYVLEQGLKGNPMGVIAFDKKTDEGWKHTGVIVTAEINTALDMGTVQAVIGPISNPTGLSLGLAMLSAFLGGMILNLMPCVFPVLSLKALGFAKTAHANPSLVRKHGLFYTLGVLISFIVLAVTLLALKAGGAAIGWGFQLQNPIMVAALALLFFIIALNLFGLFEIGGRLQNTGGNLAHTGGGKGAFFTGVLAVIVATPCTAPFMASALGYALAQPALSALLVFLALGLGFALPFLALSFAPKLLRLLPKPGPWMDTFKQLLAFPMLAAAIWLVWVLAGVGDEDASVLTLLAALCIALAIWCFKHKTVLAKVFSGLSLLICMYLLSNIKTAPPAPLDFSQTAWSTERVTQLRAEGHPVFVDFTARWCVSCKVNEKLVLHTDAAKKLFAETGTKVLIADWTRKDEVIANELARHGRSGVPLYLLYPSGTQDVAPYILPQTLTFKSLEKALKTAQ